MYIPTKRLTAKPLIAFFLALSPFLFTQSLLGSDPSVSIEDTSSKKLVCYFRPPEGWQPADPTHLSSFVKIGFLRPQKSGFRPSLNLAEEPVDCNLEQYLEAVKKIHKSDHHNDWSDLGKLETPAGVAALTQIDAPSAWGTIRMMQLILIRNRTAYILTGAALRENFTQVAQEFKQAFSSLTLTEDLYHEIAEDPKRARLRELFTAATNSPGLSPKKIGESPEWKNFQKMVFDQCNDLGSYWQILLLASSQAEILKSLETQVTND